MGDKPLRLSVCLRTTEYRGDHAAEIVTFHELSTGPNGDSAETVEQLVRRLLKPDTQPRANGALGIDWIEIRIVQPVTIP